MNKFKKKCNKKRRIISSKNEKRKNHSFSSKVKIQLIDNPIERAIIWYNKENNQDLNKESDIDTVIRITLNFVRHNFSNYDKVSQFFQGNGSINRFQFKLDVNEMILKKYNHFQKELQI